MRFRRRASVGGKDRRDVSSVFRAAVITAPLRLRHAGSQVRSHGRRQPQGILYARGCRPNQIKSKITFIERIYESI